MSDTVPGSPEVTSTIDFLETSNDVPPDTTCLICLEEIAVDPTASAGLPGLTLSCGHSYHRECLARWVDHCLAIGSADGLRDDEEPNDERDDLYYAAGNPTSRSLPCPYCQTPSIRFIAPVASRFVVLTSSQLIAATSLGTSATPVGPSTITENERVWRDDPEFEAFWRQVHQQPTYSVPDVLPPGHEIWRGTTTIHWGALKLHQHGSRYKILLLPPRRRFRYFCKLFAAGWDPVSGTCGGRVDVDQLRGRPLWEVIQHAVGQQVYHISQLDFESIWSDQKFVQRRLVPHVGMTYHHSHLSLGRPVASVWAGVGRWDEEDDIFESYIGDQQEQANEIFESLGGLTPPDTTDPLYHVTRGFHKALFEPEYTERMALYERPPVHTPTGRIHGGYEEIPKTTESP